MKTHLLLLCFGLAAVAAQAEQPAAWAPSITLQHIEDHKEVDGCWTLSSEWTGYMGTALELHDGRFRYWFMSDVRLRDSPKYPVTGKYTIEGGVLVLATEEITESRWLLVSHNGRLGLFPASGFETITARKESPHLRMLFRVPDEVAKVSWPIYNEPR